MNIKNTAIVTVSLIFAMIISVLILNYISKCKLRSVNLPAVSCKKEKKEQIVQTTRTPESIADRGMSKVEEKTEERVLYQPVSEKEQKVEIEYPEESVLEISYDDALRDTEQRNKNIGLGNREAETIMKEGPLSQRIVKSLPIFKPIINDTGPMLKDSDKTHSELPETTEEYDYDGPPVPPGLETKPLPLFAPITNKTGPIAN